jgi:hypothetical protein
MQDAVKNEIKKLKRLVQFKGSSDEALTKIAEKNVVLRELVEEGQFLDDAEKKQAKKIFEAYLSAHNFETQSDLSTLSILVWDEILVGRLKKTINDCSTSDGKSFINDKLVKSLNDLTSHILQIKLKLGLDKEADEDEMTALGLLKKRFHEFIQFNKHEFTLAVPFSCSSCGKDDVKMVLVRRNVKDFSAIDHPHFSGRFWYNKVAIEMVKSGRLTKEEYAKIFSTSVDYCQWVLDNEGRIIQNTKESK